ncbi:MAG: branched-chain amino acid ABC transporter permease [Pseudomonadota bacterium]
MAIIDPLFLAQLAANGIMVGAGYALAAVGLTLMFGILEKVNFAHGELYMLAAFLLYFILRQTGLPYLAGVVILLPAMALAGWVLARGVLIPTLDRSFESAILATLALGVILQNAVRLLFGASPLRIASPYDGMTLDLFGVLLFGQRLLVMLVAAMTLGGLALLLRRTRIGAAMRAAAQSKEACLMVGIDVRRVTIWTCCLGTMLCGVAGAAIGPLFDLYPSMGTDVVFKSFAVVIIGGMGNLPGAAVAGLALGLAESFAGGLGGGAMRDGISFVAMIAILLLRPNGLFGRAVRI